MSTLALAPEKINQMLIADWGGSFLRLLVPSVQSTAFEMQNYDLDAEALQPGPDFVNSLGYVLENLPDNVTGRTLLMIGMTGEQLLKPPPCEDLQFIIEFRSMQLRVYIMGVEGREEIVGELSSCLLASEIMGAPPTCATVAFGSSVIRAAFKQEDGTYSIKEIVPGGHFLNKGLTNAVAPIFEELLRNDLPGLTDPPVIYLLGGFSFGLLDFNGRLGLGPLDDIIHFSSMILRLGLQKTLFGSRAGAILNFDPGILGGLGPL
jgi:hypothetical protein